MGIDDERARQARQAERRALEMIEQTQLQIQTHERAIRALNDKLCTARTAYREAQARSAAIARLQEGQPWKR